MHQDLPGPRRMLGISLGGGIFANKPSLLPVTCRLAEPIVLTMLQDELYLAQAPCGFTLDSSSYLVSSAPNASTIRSCRIKVHNRRTHSLSQLRKCLYFIPRSKVYQEGVCDRRHSVDLAVAKRMRISAYRKSPAPSTSQN